MADEKPRPLAELIAEGKVQLGNPQPSLLDWDDGCGCEQTEAGEILCTNHRDSYKVGDGVQILDSYDWGQGQFAGWKAYVTEVIDLRDRYPDVLLYVVKVHLHAIGCPVYPSDLVQPWPGAEEAP